jgi:hypothetical protein
MQAIEEVAESFDKMASQQAPTPRVLEPTPRVMNHTSPQTHHQGCQPQGAVANTKGDGSHLVHRLTPRVPTDQPTQPTSTEEVPGIPWRGLRQHQPAIISQEEQAYNLWPRHFREYKQPMPSWITSQVNSWSVTDCSKDQTYAQSGKWLSQTNWAASPRGSGTLRGLPQLNS